MKKDLKHGVTWKYKDGTKTTFIYEMTGGYDEKTMKPFSRFYDSQRELLQDVIAKELYIVDLTISILKDKSGNKIITEIVEII